MLQSCTAVLHGHRVSYLRAGEGSAVVLLHGIGSNSLTWEPVASALAEAHDVIAPDFLGHGASAKPRGDYSLGAFASGVRDLLQLHRRRARHDRRALAGRRRGDAARLPAPRAVRAPRPRLERRPRPRASARCCARPRCPARNGCCRSSPARPAGWGPRWAACSRAWACARATTWPRWGAAWPTSATARRAWPSSTPCAPWLARAASA